MTELSRQTRFELFLESDFPLYAPARPTVQCARFVRQTGGVCYYALVVLALEPLHNMTHIVIDNPLPHTVLPPEFVPAVVEGIEREAQAYQLTPDETVAVTGFRALFLDAQIHAVDSNRFAFAMAGRVWAGKAFATAELAPIAVGFPSEGEGELVTAEQAFIQHQTALTKRLDTILVEGIHPGLKRLGFIAHTPFLFYRPVNDLYHVIRVNGRGPNLWCDISLSLTVSVPALSQLHGIDQPLDHIARSPHHLGWHRLAGIANASHVWFSLASHYRLDDTAEQMMQQVVAHGMAWFAQPAVQSSEGLIQLMRNEIEGPRLWRGTTIVAGLIFSNGRRQEAFDLIDAKIAQTADNDWSLAGLRHLRQRLETA